MRDREKLRTEPPPRARVCYWQVGQYPFVPLGVRERNNQAIMERNIVNVNYVVPSGASEECKDLISKIFVYDATNDPHITTVPYDRPLATHLLYAPPIHVRNTPCCHDADSKIYRTNDCSIE